MMPSIQCTKIAICPVENNNTGKNCPTLVPPSPDFVASCRYGIQKKISDGCVVGYACITSTNPPIRACVSNDHIEEMNALLKALKDAELANDTSQIDAIKSKIDAVQKGVQSDNQNCGASSTTAVNPASVSTGPAQIVDYYKTKISDIGAGDVNAQIEALKRLRSDIDNMINDLVSNHTEINTTQMNALVKEFYIGPNSGSADGQNIPVAGKTFVGEVNNAALAITPTSEGVSIVSDGVSADAANATLDNDTLKVGHSIVTVLPDVAVARNNIVPTSIRLVENQNGPVYNVNSVEKRKIIGIISTDVPTSTVIDATSGDKIKESRPWWAFITTG